MANLFDVAAGLSQYDDPGHGHGSTEQLSVLSLLDDTLLNIYASPKSQEPPPLAMPIIARAASLPTVDPAALGSGRRPRPAAPISPPPPLRLPAVVRPTEAATPAPPNNQLNANSTRSPKPAASNTEADVVARNVLRDITEEMEQLSLVTPPDIPLIVRMLQDKYLERTLSKLPRTPFVQLACRKVQQKLDRLSQRSVQPAAASSPAKIEDPQVHHEPEDHVVATWQKLQTITPEQQQMLRNLVRVPSARLLALPPAQQELVRFAKRYEKLLTLTPQDLQLLPTRHQQLIGKMQSQRRASLPATTGNQ